MALETGRHQQLKRLALAWAQAVGYEVAGIEISLPQLRFRLDVAAYRAATRLERTPGGRHVHVATMGTTAIFECKQSRADFLTDSRRSAVLSERLLRLHSRKQCHEILLRLNYPTLRTGDSLFPEWESCDFARSGDELYLKLLARLQTATRQLHEGDEVREARPLGLSQSSLRRERAWSVAEARIA